MCVPNVLRFGFGRITLSDGAVIVLRIAIVSVKKLNDFSPFGGVNLAVKVVGGVSLAEIPEELKRVVADKPVTSPDKPPRDGWEYVEIREQEPAFEEAEVVVDGRKFVVRVEAEALMVVRNLSYRTEAGEPMYVVNWVNKVRWRPAGE